jgi:hypothetical protein
MTKMKVAHDRDRSRERMAGWHRPECERGDERGTDLSEDGVIGRGDRDGIDRSGRISLRASSTSRPRSFHPIAASTAAPISPPDILAASKAAPSWASSRICR